MTTREKFFPVALRGIVAASGLALALLSDLGGGALAGELPKEGAFKATFIAQGRNTAVQLGAEKWGWTWAGRIAALSDSGMGPYHNMSGDCLGMGVDDQGSGYCTYSDADGDMIFERWEEPAAGKGTISALGGTGKFQGIQYTGDYDYVALPSPEGTVHLAGRKRGSYKLP